MSLNNPNSEKFKLEPRPCPVCGKNDMVIPIVYGFPGPTLFEDEANGKVMLGGCTVWHGDPSWYCKRDEIKF